MKCKGYTPDYKATSGKKDIIFTKEIYNPKKGVDKALEGLVVVHKIKIDVHMGAVQKHWMENRYLGIADWKYLDLLNKLFKDSIDTYNKIKCWMKKGWILDAYEELTNTNTKKKGTK
jgi:hypothetical protein